MNQRKSIILTNGRLDANRLEEALQKSGIDPHNHNVYGVSFLFPENCIPMIDASVRLLSLVNQLDFLGKKVTLHILDKINDTMKYLCMIRFFDFLNEGIEVLPFRPPCSTESSPFDTSFGLVMIERIKLCQRDKTLPSILSAIFALHSANSRALGNIGNVAYTLFAELIDNVYRHSSSKIDAIAALQVNPHNSTAKVVVSDSGEGILETLRPSLMQNHPNLVYYSDTNLIVKVFQDGLSRFREGHGSGLRACAVQAMKFGAILDVRLARLRVHLAPGVGGYQPAMAYCADNLVEIWGTHICFDFDMF